MDYLRDILQIVRDILPAAVVLAQTRDRQCPPCPSLACSKAAPCPELSCATPVLSCPAVTCGNCTCPTGPVGSVGLFALLGAALVGLLVGGGAVHLYHLASSARRPSASAAEAPVVDKELAETPGTHLVERRAVQERFRRHALTLNA